MSIMSEFDNEDDISLDEYHEDRESNEDTEDASETDMVKQVEEYTEIKEQIYQEKLKVLKHQMKQLMERTHPEFQMRVQQLEEQHTGEINAINAYYDYQREVVERECREEARALELNFERRKAELKEGLIAELEDKRRLIEAERTSIELTGDTMEVKPVSTRKLRRRPNDPLPLPERRRKNSPAQINHLLEDHKIMEDLKAINKGGGRLHRWMEGVRTVDLTEEDSSLLQTDEDDDPMDDTCLTRPRPARCQRPRSSM